LRRLARDAEGTAYVSPAAPAVALPSDRVYNGLLKLTPKLHEFG